MSELYYDDFSQYLKSKGINQVTLFLKSKTPEPLLLKTESIEEHLSIICGFHKKTMGFSGYLNKRLNNYTGKRVEEYKIYIKKVSRDLKRINDAGINNSFEELLTLKGPGMILRAEKAVKMVYDSGYYELVNRSMKRIEVCLGNTYHTNLCKGTSNSIEIIDLRHCGYNMVEWDGIYYLNKLKKKGIALDVNALISKYCMFEGLESTSESFMLAMLSYPNEFMRCCNRYRYGKKDWDDEEYSDELIVAMEKDGEGFID